MRRLNIGLAYLNTQSIETLIQHLSKVCQSSKWHSRRAAIEFTQNLIFCNLFNIRPYAEQFHQILMKCLYDEQYEVRLSASITLSGSYQCHFIQITKEDIVLLHSSFLLSNFILF